MSKSWQPVYDVVKPKVDVIWARLSATNGVPAAIIDIIPETISAVDDAVQDLKPLTGDERIDVISHLINDYVDIPGVPDFLEDDVIRFVLRVVNSAITKATEKKDASGNP